MLKIDENFKIEPDGNNCILIHTETKTRLIKGSDQEETYTVDTPYYYPNVEGCFRTYMHKCLEPCEDVPAAIKKLDELHATIKKAIKQIG